MSYRRTRESGIKACARRRAEACSQLRRNGPGNNRRSQCFGTAAESWDRLRSLFGMLRSLFDIGLSHESKCPLKNPGHLVPFGVDNSEATTRGFGTLFPDFPLPAGHK